jgi:molybdopterin synthase sulfur carrier subunit
LGKIKVIFSSALTNTTNGEKEAYIEASSVREALEKLVLKYGNDFKERIFESENKLRRFINVYVNRRDIRFLKGPESPVKSGDEVTLLPAISGGGD